MRKIAFLFTLCGFLFSCEEYTPKGEHFVIVDGLVVKEAPELKLNNNGDTITLLKNTLLEFEIISHDNRILDIDIEATGYDFEPSITSDFSSGFFNLESSNAFTDYYPLIIKVYFDSKTKSLAHSLGAEVYYIEYKWLLHYSPVSTGRNNSSFFRTYYSNGKVVLIWNKYTLTDFKRYIVSKVEPFSNTTIWSKSITDYNTNFIYDDNPNASGTNKYYLKIIREGAIVEDMVFY
jgi:hypothetical protein